MGTPVIHSYIKSRVWDLLGDDTVTLDASSKPKVQLYYNSVELSDDIEIGSFTVTAGAGVAAIAASGSPQQYRSEIAGDRKISIPGEFFFQPTTTNYLPLTAYGYVVTNNAATQVYWAEEFTEPVTFSNTEQAVEVNPVLTLKNNGMA